MWSSLIETDLTCEVNIWEELNDCSLHISRPILLELWLFLFRFFGIHLRLSINEIDFLHSLRSSWRFFRLRRLVSSCFSRFSLGYLSYWEWIAHHLSTRREFGLLVFLWLLSKCIQWLWLSCPASALFTVTFHRWATCSLGSASGTFLSRVSFAIFSNLKWRFPLTHNLMIFEYVPWSLPVFSEFSCFL